MCLLQPLLAMVSLFTSLLSSPPFLFVSSSRLCAFYRDGQELLVPPCNSLVALMLAALLFQCTCFRHKGFCNDLLETIHLCCASYCKAEFLFNSIRSSKPLCHSTKEAFKEHSALVLRDQPQDVHQIITNYAKQSPFGGTLLSSSSGIWQMQIRRAFKFIEGCVHSHNCMFLRRLLQILAA